MNDRSNGWSNMTDSSIISMMSYDDLMVAIDPDPFFNADSLLLSNSSSNYVHHNNLHNKYDTFYSSSNATSIVEESESDLQSPDSSSDQCSSRTELTENDDSDKTSFDFWSTICSGGGTYGSDDSTVETRDRFKESKSYEPKSRNEPFCRGRISEHDHSSLQESSTSSNSNTDTNTNSFQKEWSVDDSVDETQSTASMSFLDNYGNPTNQMELNDLHKDALRSFNPRNFPLIDGGSRSFNAFLNSAPNARNERDPTPLFTLMRNKQWELVYQRIQSHPSELQVWIYKLDTIDGSMKWAILPIHAACIFGSPSSIMRSMIKAYPKGVTTGDSGWRLPIHLACYSCKSANHVRMLLKASPPSINVADVFGHRCITLALESNGPLRSEVLRILDNGVLDYDTHHLNSSPQQMRHARRNQGTYNDQHQLPPTHPKSVHEKHKGLKFPHLKGVRTLIPRTRRFLR